MTAGVVHALGQVQCELVHMPEPRDGSVLVRSILSSICGSDLHIAYQGWSVTEFPLEPGHPGHEGVGEVVDGGRTGFQPGDLVLTVPYISKSKTFAEYQLLGPQNLLRLPATKPISHLVMAQQLGTVIFGCHQLPHLEGKTVVVIGQGPVGLLHNFVLRNLGAERIIGIEPIYHRLREANKMGVDEPISETGPAATSAVMDITEGHGADIVVDAVGSVETLNQAVAMSGKSGRVAAFGLPSTMEMVPFDWATFFRRSLSMHAVHGAQEVPGLPDFQAAVDLIIDDKIDMSAFITHQFHIEQINKAFEVAYLKPDGVMKVSVTF